MINKFKSPFFYSVLVHATLVILILVLMIEDEVKKENVSISIDQIISNQEIKKAFHRAIHNLHIPHTEPVDDRIAPPDEGQGHTSDSLETSEEAYGGAEATEMQKYFLEILNRINRAKTYPKDAQFNEQEGVVQVLLQISPDGKILSAALEKSAPFKSLNDAAMIAVQKIGTLPPLPLKPSGLPVSKAISIHIPIRFQLK